MTDFAIANAAPSAAGVAAQRPVPVPPVLDEDDARIEAEIDAMVAADATGEDHVEVEVGAALAALPLDIPDAPPLPGAIAELRAAMDHLAALKVRAEEAKAAIPALKQAADAAAKAVEAAERDVAMSEGSEQQAEAAEAAARAATKVLRRGEITVRGLDTALAEMLDDERSPLIALIEAASHALHEWRQQRIAALSPAYGRLAAALASMLRDVMMLSDAVGLSVPMAVARVPATLADLAGLPVPLAFRGMEAVAGDGVAEALQAGALINEARRTVWPRG